MQASDKKEKDRQDSRNALEEYVYNMRDKLHSSLDKFITSEVGSCGSLALSPLADRLIASSPAPLGSLWKCRALMRPVLGYPILRHGRVDSVYSFYSAGPGSIPRRGTCLLTEPDACYICV